MHPECQLCLSFTNINGLNEKIYIYIYIRTLYLNQVLDLEHLSICHQIKYPYTNTMYLNYILDLYVSRDLNEKYEKTESERCH